MTETAEAVTGTATAKDEGVWEKIKKLFSKSQKTQREVAPIKKDNKYGNLGAGGRGGTEAYSSTDKALDDEFNQR